MDLQTAQQIVAASGPIIALGDAQTAMGNATNAGQILCGLQMTGPQIDLTQINLTDKQSADILNFIVTYIQGLSATASAAADAIVAPIAAASALTVSASAQSAG